MKIDNEVMKLDFPMVYAGYFINNCKDNLTEEEIKDADSIIKNLNKRHISIVSTENGGEYKSQEWKIGNHYVWMQICTYVCIRQIFRRKKE